jgi:DNA-binding response OmpR family regulator
MNPAAPVQPCTDNMRKILVVDDEKVITSSIKSYFTRLGAAVDTAAEREEAEGLLATRHYDVAIVDLRLAGSDGREGLDLFRFARDRGLALPIILMTANPSESAEALARQLGVDAFLRKPIPLQKMARVVDELLLQPRPASANKGDNMTKKILLVDDSQTVLLMHKMILGKHWQIVTARDGQEGVDTALSEKPDLILMDVVMPRLSGFEAVQQLRQHESTRETPIIMVTTRGEEENIESGYELGCTDYITKPVNNVELMTKVRCYIGE